MGFLQPLPTKFGCLYTSAHRFQDSASDPSSSSSHFTFHISKSFVPLVFYPSTILRLPATPALRIIASQESPSDHLTHRSPSLALLIFNPISHRLRRRRRRRHPNQSTAVFASDTSFRCRAGSSIVLFLTYLTSHRRSTTVLYPYIAASCRRHVGGMMKSVEKADDMVWWQLMRG